MRSLFIALKFGDWLASLAPVVSGISNQIFFFATLFILAEDEPSKADFLFLRLQTFSCKAT
jgi:hypothetical protein